MLQYCHSKCGVVGGKQCVKFANFRENTKELIVSFYETLIYAVSAAFCVTGNSLFESELI